MTIEEIKNAYTLKELCRFKIKVKPQAKQSVRIGRHGAFADPKKKAYQRHLRALIIEQIGGLTPTKKPVKISVVFSFEFRKKEAKRDKLRGFYFMATRPDYDNLVKPLHDAMNGLVYHDDSQAVTGELFQIRSKDNYIEVIAETIEYK